MKKLVTLITVLSIFCFSANAQFNIYMRLTDYNGQVLTTNGVLENETEVNASTFEASSKISKLLRNQKPPRNPRRARPPRRPPRTTFPR